jgi:cytosylglucuronate decarboxylase
VDARRTERNCLTTPAQLHTKTRTEYVDAGATPAIVYRPDRDGGTQLLDTTEPEYLFIRLLETCNADCYMCEFALSRDKYRFEPDDMRSVVANAQRDGVKYVRLTGGEPLLHRNIVLLLKIISEHGVRSSIITNGYLLRRRAAELRDAGLGQVIVSIDGLQETHDGIRGTRGLFERAVAGIEAAVAEGMLVRVNTVVGPNNFREVPELQTLFTELGVQQWELSSLKLERPLDWTKDDVRDMPAIVDAVYRAGRAAGKLVPLGKIWCGETDEEFRRYVDTGVTPRADERCHVVRRVRYLDAKNRMQFPCSLLVHRPGAGDYGAAVVDWHGFSVNEPQIEALADRFERDGPLVCTGCSSTAAGFSNELAAGRGRKPWSF